MQQTTPITLNFDCYGQPEAQALVILHGFFASSRNWRQIARRLAEQYHVFVLDLRNHGDSPHSPIMDYPSMAADVLAFLDVHKLQKPVLIGHSMGGKVAMHLALQAPERIAELVIVDIAPVSYQHDFSNTLQALKNLPLHEMANRKQAEQYLEKDIPELAYRQFHLQNLQLIDGHLQWRINLDYFSQNAHFIPAFPDDLLGETFDRESLFITGGNSKYIQPDYSDAMYQYFPQASLQVILNTGHWLHAEAPEAFLAALDSWL